MWLATLLVFLTLAVPASAAVPAGLEPRIEASLATAERTFGEVPCGRPQVHFARLSPEYSGWAHPDRCLILLNSDLGQLYWVWPNFCTTIVHEYGHLAEWLHSEDPENVMVGRSPLLWFSGCLDYDRVRYRGAAQSYWYGHL
jgi:hypothetical protein